MIMQEGVRRMTQQLPLAERMGYVLKQVQQALRTAMDEALRQHGVTTAQYSVLRVLEEDSGLSGAALARRCFVAPQTANEMVTHLERLELVERHRSDDARVLRTYLTSEGRRLVHACDREVATIEDRMLRPLSETERQQLVKHLQQCVAALDDAHEQRQRA